MALTQGIERYERQILFGPLGEAGQAGLCGKIVLVAGVGALGTNVAGMLVRAGVSVRLVDHDTVELSNLQRQSLYDETDVAEGRPKVHAAAEKLQVCNSRVSIEPIVARIDPDNAAELVAGTDLIIDGVDNFAAKFALNRAACDADIPFIYGAVSGSYGLTKVIRPGRDACLCCLYCREPDRDSSETAATAGVIAPVVNVIASLQVAAALKILAGCDRDTVEDLVQVDVWDVEMCRIPVARRANCPACGGLIG
ncbi:MAG: ThiF family adenylyltransferase [Acidobacteriota bacterium]|nr:ThiF family adenylyltransferase [Acidobacteriota bacterium]